MSTAATYLVDTDVVITALKGRQPAIQDIRHAGTAGIAISVISIGELLEGAYGSIDPQGHTASLRGFIASFEVLDVTEPIVDGFAQERARLRRLGQIIPDLDLLIGVTAVHYNLLLLTYNVRHFGRISGLHLAPLTGA